MKPYANCHRNWVLITAAIQPQGGLGNRRMGSEPVRPDDAGMDRHLATLPGAATAALFTSVVVMIGVELAIDRFRQRRIDVRDSANSMAIGLGYLGFKVIAGKALGFALY